MPFAKKKDTRINILAVFLAVIIALSTMRLVYLGVVNANKYLSDDGVTTRTATLKAPRGEILDCFGRQIAINRDGYNIVFNTAYIKDNLNDIILSLINLASEYQTEWVDRLPMEMTSPYNFKKDESTEKMLSTLKLAHYATAENCFDAMVELYDLQDYSQDDKRKIMGVRYSMQISDFSISYPFTFAEDISSELMRKVSESAFALSGVTIDVVPFREYTDTTLAVNLIGSVGPIFEEDWEYYKERGYSYDDKVGKSGIEKWGEEYLRGTDGEITYRLDTEVNIGIMRNYKAIYMVGDGRLTHDTDGFKLTGCDGKLNYEHAPTKSYGLYADYFWYEIGDVISIGNKDAIYYCFPKENAIVAKARLAAEELYKIKKQTKTTMTAGVKNG